MKWRGKICHELLGKSNFTAYFSACIPKTDALRVSSYANKFFISTHSISKNLNIL